MQRELFDCIKQRAEQNSVGGKKSQKSDSEVACSFACRSTVLTTESTDADCIGCSTFYVDLNRRLWDDYRHRRCLTNVRLNLQQCMTKQPHRHRLQPWEENLLCTPASADPDFVLHFKYIFLTFKACLLLLQENVTTVMCLKTPEMALDNKTYSRFIHL